MTTIDLKPQMRLRPVLLPRDRSTDKRPWLLATRRWSPLLLIALSALAAAWALCVQLPLGIRDDELLSLNQFIAPGPSGIWGQYIANDHMLYELLTWVLRALTGDHGDAILRFWSVVPALASVAVLARWLWVRLGRWQAVAFVTLIAAAPIFVFLGGEGRGYGLAFLGSALLLVGADAYHERRRRSALMVFALGAITGMWTLPVFVLPVIALGILLLLTVSPRRDLIVTFAATAILTIVFYVPVLGGLTTATKGQFGAPLPAGGFVTGPLRDQLQPSLETLLPHLAGQPVNSLTTAIQANQLIDEGTPYITARVAAAINSGAASHRVELIAGLLVLCGFLSLYLAGNRFLALALLAPSVFTYLALEVLRYWVSARFTSFLFAPLLVLSVVGVGAIVALLARLRPARPVLIVAGLALYALALYRADGLARVAAQDLDGYDTAAAVVSGSGIKTVVSNLGWGTARYLPAGAITTETPARLEQVLCSAQAPLVYVEDDRDPHSSPSTTCLTPDAAERVRIPNRRQVPFYVWLILRARTTADATRSAVSTPSPTPAITAAPKRVPATGPIRASSTISWHVAGNRAVWLYVSVNGKTPVPMTSGQGSGHVVARWITAGSVYRFSLYPAAGRRKLLGSVTVTRGR